RRRAAGVGEHGVGERRVARLVQQLEAVDRERLLLADAHGGAPLSPAGAALRAVELGAEHAEDDGGLGGHPCGCSGGGRRDEASRVVRAASWSGYENVKDGLPVGRCRLYFPPARCGAWPISRMFPHLL